MSDKQRYRGPDIVDVGDVRTITTSDGTPVRDNPNEEPPTWYDSSKDPTSPGNRPGGPREDEGGSEAPPEGE